MKRESNTPVTVLGVGWYRPEQWALLLAESVDRDKLASTHAEWLAIAKVSLDRMRAAGQHPVKIEIDVEEMIAWCSKQGLLLNGSARAQFIAHKTTQENRKTKSKMNPAHAVNRSTDLRH
jgi:hypothetical protein